MNEDLRRDNERLAQALTRARQQLATARDALQKLRQPPGSYAVFVAAFEAERQAEVDQSGRRLRVQVDPAVDLAALSAGDRVRLSAELALLGPAGAVREGTLCEVTETLGLDRAVVATPAGSEQVVTLSGRLRHGNLRVATQLLVDLRAGVALDVVPRSKVEQMLTPQVPNVSWDQIGGLSAQIGQIRDAVELPFTHRESFERFGLSAPRGVFLYGPPGCGKTLIAKAIATALADGQREASFLSVRGPQLLNKFVGETERQVRAIFARARELAQRGLVVIFFDEMEALFKVRGSGISSDVETSIVPQFLTEMDGLESLSNVIVIGASNREDMIDPAILRGGRMDVRIEVSRPDESGACQILGIHLDSSVPVAGDRERVLAELAAVLYGPVPAVRVLTAAGESVLEASSLLSGAALAAIVQRAKQSAVKRLIAGGDEGVTKADLLAAANEELAELSRLAASSAPEAFVRTVGWHGPAPKRLEAIFEGLR